MDFADKTGAIGQLWIEFRNDEDFSAFMDYNDLGCPMAYMMAEGLISDKAVADMALCYISEYDVEDMMRTNGLLEDEVVEK